MSVTSARVFVDALVMTGASERKPVENRERLNVEEMTIGDLVDFITRHKVPRQTPVFIDAGMANATIATGAVYDREDGDFQIG